MFTVDKIFKIRLVGLIADVSECFETVTNHKLFYSKRLKIENEVVACTYE